MHTTIRESSLLMLIIDVNTSILIYKFYISHVIFRFPPVSSSAAYAAAFFIIFAIWLSSTDAAPCLHALRLYAIITKSAPAKMPTHAWRYMLPGPFSIQHNMPIEKLYAAAAKV